MNKILLAKVFFTFIALGFASFAWAVQPEVHGVQAAISAKGAGWVAGDTSMGALTPEERLIRVSFSQPPPTGPRTPLPAIPIQHLAPSLDWRNNNGNFVTGVRDQGSCGSCWAFASVAGLESQTLIVNHTPGVDLDLSEQVAVSCSGFGSCYGGYLVDTYFVTTGIPLESCYPYTATNGACGNACADWNASAYKVSRYTWIVPYGSQQTVDALKYALVTFGPTPVTMAVYNDFYWYRSGIYTHVTGSLQGYHAILLVGYDDVNSCFIVKNSWGGGWGESGFFRIAYSELTGDTSFGYEALSYGESQVTPVSTVTSPVNGSTVFGTTTITGTAGIGVAKVEVGITAGGGATDWRQAAGTSQWSCVWVPTEAGSYNIKSRASDVAGNTETPDAGINVTAERGLSVDKDTVDVTYPAGAPAETSTINLSSVGTINYTAASDSPWLTVSPESELTPRTLTLTINPNTQTPGFISGNITISSPLAVNSPKVVPVNVIITAPGKPELQHFDWNVEKQGQGCASCHQASSQFLPADYRNKISFCWSCHNPGGQAHGRDLLCKRQHTMMVNVTSGGNKFPTYGEITAFEYNNQPFSQLGTGDKVICVTCHNPMSKSEDYSRVWEMTITDDRLTYWLEKGGWSRYGGLKPLVYRDTSVWAAGGPACSETKKGYLVDPSEYSYDEDAGSIIFRTGQDQAAYIYVTLDYPYLRASNQDNRLCQDCHSQATHEGANCLSCHSAHSTCSRYSCNIAGIREKVRTPDHLDTQVIFLRYTGANSFADGDTTHDGICEVCHTATSCYRRDGSGSANHHDGDCYDRVDCTSCHRHSSGFAANGSTPVSVFVQIVSPLPDSTVNGDVAIQVYATLTNGASVTGPIRVCIDNASWQDCTLNQATGFWQYVWHTNPLDFNVSHTVLARGTSGLLTATASPVTVTVANPDQIPPAISVDHLTYGTTTVNSPGTSLSIKRGTTLTWYVAASDNRSLMTSGGVTVEYNIASPPVSDITPSLSGGFYRYTLTLPNVRNQSCTFKFTATDSSGNAANTAIYTITTN